MGPRGATSGGISSSRICSPRPAWPRGSAPQTMRQAWPAAARCSSHTRLLRVAPPRGGTYDALAVSRMRMVRRRFRRALPPRRAARAPLRRKAAPLLHQRGVLARAGLLDFLQLHRPGQLRDGEIAAVDHLQRQVHAESLPHARKQLHGQQGVAAQVEEVVVDPDGRHVQQLLPDGGQAAPPLPSRRVRVERLPGACEVRRRGSIRARGAGRAIPWRCGRNPRGTRRLGRRAGPGRRPWPRACRACTRPRRQRRRESGIRAAPGAPATLSRNSSAGRLRSVRRERTSTRARPRASASSPRAASMRCSTPRPSARQLSRNVSTATASGVVSNSMTPVSP